MDSTQPATTGTPGEPALPAGVVQHGCGQPECDGCGLGIQLAAMSTALRVTAAHLRLSTGHVRLLEDPQQQLAMVPILEAINTHIELTSHGIARLLLLAVGKPIDAGGIEPCVLRLTAREEKGGSING